MADSKLLVVLHPAPVSPVLLQLVLSFASDEDRQKVKLQGVGARNCPVLVLKANPATGDCLYGEEAVVQYFARIFGLKSLIALGDAFQEVEVIQWLSFLHNVKSSSPKTWLPELNSHLSFRSVFVGYHLTLADLAVWTAIFVNEEARSLVNENDFPHLARFLRYCSSFPQIAQVESTKSPVEVNDASKEKGSAFLQLKGNPSKVVSRFPPEPSGYMHIGHCKAAMLNQYYAQSTGGKLIIRMDDTNPSNEKDEFTQAILEDLASLGIKGDVYSHTSDHFDYLISCCEKLIEAGHLYVDSSKAEDIQKMREKREPSPFRDRSAEENLKLWKMMKDGEPEGTQYVVRAKIDYASDNGCLRDPNVFRCVPNVPHPRMGFKYKVYPLYDFACPLVDAREGVTHALRSSEYHDHNALYDWVLGAMGIKGGPIIEDFSRLNFTYTILSKRKLQWFVNEGKVEGWDDPCFPTVRGVFRRGMTVEALRKFILQQGSSKNLNLMDMGKLWALNKQIIDPIVPRYVAVVEPVLVKISNFFEPEIRSRELHKKNPSLGKKTVHFSNEILFDKEDAVSLEAGEEVTLMDWGNAIIQSFEKSASGDITVVHATLHLEGDFKTTKKKLTWVSNVPSDLIPIELVECQNLLTKPKLEKETKDRPADKFEDFIPQQLKIKTLALGEAALKMLGKGDKIQLERKGYFICDKAYLDYQHDVSPSPLVLINIPDGKQKK